MRAAPKRKESAPPPSPTPLVAKKRIEEQQVQKRVAIGAHIVHETIRREGEQELQRTWSALGWSGFAAGLSMGFSLVAEGLLSAFLPTAAWTPLVSKLGYSVGFLIVVLGRQQLFTETTLTAMLPLFSSRDAKTAMGVLRLWGIVLVANLVGAYLFALTVARIPIFSPHIYQSMLEVSRGGAQGGWAVIFVRAIFAGWLIALMVWLLPAAESAKVSIIIIITYIIGLGGFNHVIAGSVKMLFLVVRGASSWHEYFMQFFLPTLFGNIVGGVSLVAFLGHAQVVADNESE